MGDLEEFEVKMLRRDEEIEGYSYWWDENRIDLEAATFETLLSWVEYTTYCIGGGCGDYKKAVKTSTNRQFYELECGHNAPRWDWDHDWDDEIEAWIPRN